MDRRSIALVNATSKGGRESHGKSRDEIIGGLRWGERAFTFVKWGGVNILDRTWGSITRGKRYDSFFPRGEIVSAVLRIFCGLCSQENNQTKWDGMKEY